MTTPAVLRRGRRAFAERRVEWVPTAWEYSTARELLKWLADELHPEAPELVVALVGAEGRTLETCRRWLQGAPLPDGWAGDGHYMRPPAPVFRFAHRDGRRVTVLRAAAWWGEGDYTAEEAAGAWERLGELIRGQFDEGRLLLTPASTGRYLLLRCITFGREWPALTDELQELIRATSGQGRIQHLDPGELAGSIVTLDGYDARLAYAACATELGAGVPERDEVDEFAGHRRGRYRVRVTVPADWRDACACGAPGHRGIGLLPSPELDGSWSYPAAPRQTFTTWVDGAELRLAYDHGWRVEVLERILFPWPPYPSLSRRSGQTTKRGPLDVWAPRLAALRASAAAGDPMVANALRMIVLTGIGALHGRGHRTTHVVSVDAGELPADVDDVERVDDWLVYSEGERDAARWAAMSHPEWSAAIWGRARARLLDAPGWTRADRTGALHVPAGNVLAFRTDAVWLYNHDPGWRDDGRLGRYRHAAHLEGVPLPRTARELDAVRKEHRNGS